MLVTDKKKKPSLSWTFLIGRAPFACGVLCGML
jgi:hypothetical protein